MDTLNDLRDFHKKIVQYRGLVHEPFYTNAIEDKMQILRTKLQRDYSRLESEITHYGGKGTITEPFSGIKKNVFDIAFDTIDAFNIMDNVNAIDDALILVNKAIGKLEAEGKSWEVNIEQAKEKPRRVKAFISHSGNTQALTELRDFLDEMDIEKLIVVKKPNLDRNINTKLEAYLDVADLVIILATGDSRDRDGNIIPAGNVIHEIGLAQAKPKFIGKIIYLIEDKAEFPSNIKPKGYIRFNRNNIEHRFGDIIKEIKSMGFFN